MGLTCARYTLFFNEYNAPVVMKRKPLKTLIALALGLFLWVNISLVKTAASALALTSFQSPETVVFIDPAVKEYEKLAKSVAPNTRAFILDRHLDGVGQISTVLGEYKDLKSIQIVSHGTAGVLKLGEVELTAENVGNYSQNLGQWGKALAKGGDILLYGCDVAATEVGEQFVQQVSELTGADVAASKDKTGNSNLGGDWSLEYQSGLVSSSLAFQEEAMKDYKGVLEIIKVTTNSDSGTGSLRAAIEKALSSSEDTIIDLRGISGTINLSSSLPTITGGGKLFIVGDGDETISGQNSDQILSVDTTDLLTFDTLKLSNGLAKGGDGQKGGGGGLGAGGALFIDQGKVAVQDVTFSGNKAQGGNSPENAGKGGDDEKKGDNGGNGGKFNENAAWSPFTPGKGGSGSETSDEPDKRNGKPGSGGEFGTGGGGGGGGGGGQVYGEDVAGDGGDGGIGGFGGGGGGGGGGGKDIDYQDENEDGDGGILGEGGEFAGAGDTGERTKDDDKPETPGGEGGQGGGGAGLGGAIFARSDAKLIVINSNFTDNTVEGGTGAESGQGKGQAIFTENKDERDNGDSVNFNNDDIPALSIAVANAVANRNGTVEEGEKARFTINADKTSNGDVKVYYYISDVNGAEINKDFKANEADTIILPSGETEVTLEITTLIDKVKEGDESFTITLLPTNQYKRGTKTESSATITIKDINYTAEIDYSKSKVEITEASDPLESSTKSNEIDVDKLKSIGYVTVKLDKAVNGNHFNNALAAGLPVYYKIEPKGNEGEAKDYLAPQYNYNDTVHPDKIVDAVVVPVDKDSAKLYFAALPDVVKEAPEEFTLTIETFTDSNINTALNNVLGSEYQFYEVDSTNSSAALTINDSDEFQAELIVVDSINEEVVSEENPLVPSSDGKVSFKVKLGSQPTADVTVNGVTFTSTNWNQYQPLSVNATVGTPVSLNATSADSNYNNKSIDLPTAAQYNKLKIAEGDSPDVSQRELFINVTAKFPTVKESGTSDESGFSINLSQPISRELTVNYTLGGTALIGTDYDLLGQKTVGSLSIPKYTRSVDIPINAIDNFIVDGNRDITITLSESSEFTIDEKPATITIEDNDKPAIIISQHNPDRPSDQDIAYLIPKIQIVGEDGQGGLIVQENEPLVEKITFTKVGEEGRAISSGASGQGLTKEIWVDIEGDTIEELISSPYFPDQPSEASIIPDFSVEQNTDAFGRLRGLLTPPEKGDYTFTVEGNDTAELWLNKNGSNYEGREKIASGDTISLEAGQQYYIEALYKEGTGNGKLNVKWTTPSSSDKETISSQYLTPFTINKGFIKEVWKDILGSRVEDLTSKENYPNKPSSVAWLPRLLDVSNSGDRYGTRIRGNLIPPETGKYKLWIASNANSVLKLNPEGTNPEQTQTIAKVEGTEIYGTAKLTGLTLGTLQPGEVVQVDLERINDGKEWTFELTTNVKPVLVSDKLQLINEEGNISEFDYSVSQESGESIGDNKYRNTWKISNSRGKQISFKFRTQNPFVSQNPSLENPKIDVHDLVNPEIDFPQYQQWDWNDSQESEEIFLDQGKQYYIEALQKEYLGDDYLSVAWQTPSSKVPAVISAEYLTPSNIIIPVRISATVVEEESNSEIQLKIEDQEFEYNGKTYKVSGLTLKSDGNLNFSSGFIGKIETDTAINNAETTTVQLTPVEISAENEREVTLTEGQVARLGYQLATQPEVDVTVNLTVMEQDRGAEIQLSKKEFTFTPQDWNQPQFVEVTAVKAGENYADSQIQIVAESLQGGSEYAGDKPFVNVLIVPKQLSDDYRITIKANEEVTNLGLDDTTVDEGQNLSAIQVQYRAESDADPEPVTSWEWKIENGALIAQEGAEELLRLEWSDLTLPIPQGNNPNLNLNVKVTSDFFKSGWSKGEVTISGIKIYFASKDGVAKDPDAKVTVSLVNGQPTVEAHFQLVGETGVTDVTSFSYTPQGADLPIVAFVADQESIITEFGELKVDNSGNWEFEPNINFTAGKTIVFTVNPGSKNITITPPANYDTQAQIITSQLALLDKKATRVTISASYPSVEEGQTTQLKFTLAQPDDVDTKIYYEVETPNVNAPGNIALSLEDNRYISIGENGIPLGTEFTVELWARPNQFTGIQGLLAAGEQYLRLNNRQIQFNIASPEKSVNIPDTIRDDEWFHIAYTVDASGQSSIYINGQKQWSEKQSPLESAPNITSIGKTGNTDYFKGQIDEVRLWDVARTETQIQRSRSTTVSQDDANLKGYWNFNQLTPLNLVGETSTSQLIAADGTEILDWKNPALWEVRQSATSGEDYEPISGFAETQTNLFNLDAGKLGGRTTFAVADFNKDGKTDAVVLDEYGNLYYYENIGQTASGNPQFNATKLSIKLEGAKPLTAGDINGDGDIDLLVGSEDGTIALIENTGNAIAPTFSSPIQERSDGSVLSFGQPVSPTLVDLDGDGILELFTITNSGEISSFSNSKTAFFRQQQSAVKSLSARSGEGYFLQFIDLDRDGDLDLLIDHPKNRAGELPGTLHYLENFGTSEKPYFVEATDSLIVKYIAPVLHHVTYGQQTLSHPYDQVEFYAFADWDGDGDADLLVSDNEGVIHLQENENLGYVTIPADQTEATIDVTTIEDHKVEPKEFIKVNISSGLVDSQKYYTDTLNNSAVIEIVDKDQAGIVLLNTDGTPISKPVSLAEDNPVRTTYQVKLNSRPEQGVYLKIASNSLKDGLVAKTVQGELKGEITLYFLPDEWNTPKSFVIGGVDDLIDDEQAEFKYVIKASSADYIYNSVVNQIDAVSVNNDKAGVDISLDNLPNEAGTVSLAEGAINTVKVKLTSQPTVPVTVILDPIDKQLTLYPQRKIVEIKTADPVTRKYKKSRSDAFVGEYGTLTWEPDGRYSYTQHKPADKAGLTDNFSYAIDDGYGDISHDHLGIDLPFEEGVKMPFKEGVKTQPLIQEKKGNLFYNPNQLAGDPIRLTFDRSNWNLERTVAVAAVDDDIVEYNHGSQLNVKIADPETAVMGTYGSISWTNSGEFTYTLLNGLTIEGEQTLSERFYFTQSTDLKANHLLDFTIALGDPSEATEEETKLIVTAKIDGEDIEPPLALEDGKYTGTLPNPITGLGVERMDAVYNALTLAPIPVNIEDNDKPIIRAAVNLNAQENTYPGYFTVTVDSGPVEYPGGIGIKYTVFGTEDNNGATAERQRHEGDPGPDFQGYETETLRTGTLYIPEGKQSASLPLFPIDDSTPEESLAERFEKIILKIEAPNEGDYYALDARNPDTQKAGVRIIDNEEVGLKFLLPDSGFAVDEGGETAFRVGLKSQPQQEVELKFYYKDIVYNNYPDATYLEISPVTFTRDNWNQWQLVTIGAFNNLVSNDDDLNPRYTDIYFTLGVETNDPFYNSTKGAINQVLDAEGEINTEYTIAQVKGQPISGEQTNVAGDYGNITVKPNGDYTYELTSDLLSELSDEDPQELQKTGKLLDIFDYTLNSIGRSSTVEQQLAVEIRALNLTTATDKQVGADIPGLHGTLNLKVDGSYTYTLNSSEVPVDPNWVISDRFVYYLQDQDEEEQTTETQYTLNLIITQTGDQRIAEANGEGIEIVGDVITGNAIVNSEALRTETAFTPTITKAGTTTIQTVVTNMYIRDQNGLDLRDKDDKRVLANPIFDTNPLGFADDSVKVTENTSIQGRYGELTLNSDGSYTYNFQIDEVKGVDENNEDWVVHDRFSYHLSDQTDAYLELVTFKENENPNPVVTANGVVLQSDDGITFTGNLIDNTDVTVERVGSGRFSFLLQEQTLDRAKVSEGLVLAFESLQEAVYDTDVPLIGRLGGETATDGGNTANESRTPSFLDRFTGPLRSDILAQPHFTTQGLEKALQRAINSAFGTEVPVRVIKFDTEKLLFKFSLAHGYPLVNEEFATDLGLPKVMTLDGKFILSAKYNLDVVAGVKFRNGFDAFIVTDQETLDQLLGDPKSPPTNLFTVKTSSGAVLQTDVYFSGSGGLNPEKPTITPPVGVEFDWEFGQLPPDLSIKVGPAIKKWGNAINHLGKIVGIAKEDGKEAKFIEISLEQPSAISANSEKEIQIQATVDPDNLLGSVTAELKGKRELLKGVLAHLKSQEIVFKDTEIKVADAYGEVSQPLKIDFKVKVEKYTDPTVFSVSAQTYKASVTFDSANSEKPEEKPVIVAGNTLTGNPFTTTNKAVKISAGDSTCNNLNADGKEKQCNTTSGVVNITGTRASSGYKWKWSFKANPANKLSGWNNQGTKLVDVKIYEQGITEPKVKEEYTLLRESRPWFIKTPTAEDSTTFKPVTKVAAEIGATLDVSGAAELFVLAATVKQAPMQPANPAKGGSIPEVYKQLVGKQEEPLPVIGDQSTRIEGKFGTLIINADGTYSYQLDPALYDDTKTRSIAIADKSQDDLQLNGIPSLEAVLDLPPSGGWETLPELTNVKTLKFLYEQVNAGNSEIGVSELKDEFFIATNQDKNFTKLELTLKPQKALEDSFNNQPLNSTLTFDQETHTWKGGVIFRDPVSPVVEQVSSGKIQPVGKARGFVELALKDTATTSKDGLLTLNELKGFKDALQWSVGGDTSLFLDVNAGLGKFGTGDAASPYEQSLPLPNVKFKLGLDLGYKFVGDLGDVARGGKFTFGVYDLTLDLGSLISEKLKPLIETTDDAIEPIKPVAKALSTDVKVFNKIGLQGVFDQNNNGSVTLIEVPQTLMLQLGSGAQAEKAEKIRKINKFLDFVAGIPTVINTLDDLSNQLEGQSAFDADIISADGFLVNPLDVRIVPQAGAPGEPLTSPKFMPYADALGNILIGSTESYQYEKTLGGAVNEQTVTATPAAASQTPSGNKANHKSLTKVKDQLQNLQNLGWIDFPILSNPLDVLKLIFGEPATLIQVNIPDFELEFELSKSFPVYGPVSGIIDGDIHLGTNIDLALDTLGLQEWIGTGDPRKILNGIFVPDWTTKSYESGGDTASSKPSYLGEQQTVGNKTIYDKNELYANSSISVGGGLELIGFGGFMGGGIGADGGFDLLDVGEKSSNYDGKIRALEIFDRLDDPITLFDLKLKLYAFVECLVKAFGATVWERDLARFQLAEFTLGGSSSEVGRALDSTIVGGTVFFDANLNGIFDAGEPLTFTDFQGHYAIDIPYLSFDKNDNGKIDPDEGRVVLVDGIDTSTNLPVYSPLSVVPGVEMITPLTTLMTGLVDSGMSLEESQSQIKTAFGIEQSLDLTTYDPLARLKQGDDRALKVYEAQILANNLMFHSARIYSEFTGVQTKNAYSAVIPAVAQGVADFANDAARFGDKVKLEQAAIKPLVNAIETKRGLSLSADELTKLEQVSNYLATAYDSLIKSVDAQENLVEPLTLLSGEQARLKLDVTAGLDEILNSD